MAALEVACFSPESGVIANEAGASRIELCADQDVGGITPPYEWLLHLRTSVRIPIFVMIRPRGGDFEYSRVEFEAMIKSIDEMKNEADGFVFGILSGDKIDVARTSELVQRAQPRPCTFHRAFDKIADPASALEDVVRAGCHAILSSGGADRAIEGAVKLAELVQRAAGRISIIPGGGVRLQHLAQLRRTTTAAVFHSSATRDGEQLPDRADIRSMAAMLAQ